MPSPLVFQDLPANCLDCYKNALRRKDQHLLERFERSLHDMPGAAYLEAMTYAVMDAKFHQRPEIHDDLSVGGADLKLAVDTANPIYAECKYMERSAVAQESGLEDCPLWEMEGGSYSQIIRMIQSNVKSATAQLANASDGAGVAVIGTDHGSAQTVLDDTAAEWLLTSTTHLEVPISARTGSAVGPVQVIAPLRDSVFLARPPQPGDDLRRLRIPVSAVLLYWFDVEGHWGTLIGCLNPWPSRPLDIRRFPGVPFARFASTPSIADRALPPVEWVFG
jgi:hypothetical protein